MSTDRSDLEGILDQLAEKFDAPPGNKGRTLPFDERRLILARVIADARRAALEEALHAVIDGVWPPEHYRHAERDAFLNTRGAVVSAIRALMERKEERRG
jgi:hypothetical protein